MTYRVKYRAGTYEGVRTVNADDAEQAIAKVKGWVRKQTAIPMYAESYEVVESEEVNRG